MNTSTQMVQQMVSSTSEIIVGIMPVLELILTCFFAFLAVGALWMGFKFMMAKFQ